MDEVIRVLIVDDQAQVRQGLTTVLQLAGRSTHPKITVIGAAGNGMEAIQDTQALHPDVVLMDLEMPVLNGYAASEHIKRSDPSIWIVALSIYSDPGARQKARQSGVDAFVEKGAALEDLIETIQASKRKK
jgi:DNA-binding NarL/FixJ family response regulator